MARREKCRLNRRNSQVDRGSACALFQGGDDQKVVNFEQILFASGRMVDLTETPAQRGRAFNLTF
jgi:hypothetical protein